MKKYFIAGILVWAPLSITIWVIAWGLGLLDGVFGSVMHAIIVVLPADAARDLQHFRDLPGVGILIVIVVILLTGLTAINFLVISFGGFTIIILLIADSAINSTTGFNGLTSFEVVTVA